MKWRKLLFLHFDIQTFLSTFFISSTPIHCSVPFLPPYLISLIELEEKKLITQIRGAVCERHHGRAREKRKFVTTWNVCKSPWLRDGSQCSQESGILSATARNFYLPHWSYQLRVCGGWMRTASGISKRETIIYHPSSALLCLLFSGYLIFPPFPVHHARAYTLSIFAKHTHLGGSHGGEFLCFCVICSRHSLLWKWKYSFQFSHLH